MARNLRAYFPPRSYGVVMRKGKYLSPQARAFVDLVKPGLFERRDYFDAGNLLYEHLPVLGAAIRWLKRRLA